MTDDSQLTREDLKGMRYHEIEAARVAGRLDTLLGVPPEDVAVLTKARGDGPLSLADVSHLRRLGRHQLIEAARDAGRINHNQEEN